MTRSKVDWRSAASELISQRIRANILCDMLENLDEVAWEGIAQPEWNSPDEVPNALRAVLTIQKSSDADKAYQRLLYSLGNNHAGTFYPIATAAVPFLGELLHHENVLIRQVVLNVLVDLLGAFEAAIGFETVTCSDGRTLPLKLSLRSTVGQFSTTIDRCATNSKDDAREHKLAIELLRLVEHG